MDFVGQSDVFLKLLVNVKLKLAASLDGEGVQTSLFVIGARDGWGLLQVMLFHLASDPVLRLRDEIDFVCKVSFVWAKQDAVRSSSLKEGRNGLKSWQLDMNITAGNNLIHINLTL